MREIDIIIDGRRADIYRDENVTLDFNSSILGDISSIKCSASKTIRLPKTLNNDAIFDLAHMPSRDSDKARKVLSCEMYADGVAVFSRGLCHLLSSDGDHYEVAMTFGIMHAGFEQWLTSKPKLRDLEDGQYDYIAWKSSAGVTIWLAGVSEDEQMEGMPSMFYAKYDCGVNDRSKINIHPCVTLREVYARVMKQNALRMNMPREVVEDMGNKVIVLKDVNKSLNTIGETITGLDVDASGIDKDFDDTLNKVHFNIDSKFFGPISSSFLHYGLGDVTFDVENVSLTYLNTDDDAIQAFKDAVDANPNNYALVFKRVDGQTTRIRPTTTVTNGQLKLIYDFNYAFAFNGYNENDNGKGLLKMYIELRRWEGVPDSWWRFPNSNDSTAPLLSWWRKHSLCDSVSMHINKLTSTYQENNNGYPMDRFTLSENLPDITQIDFINFLCKYYGMFPMQDGDSVAFVPFSRLYDNIDANSIYDWSERLVESYPYYPNSVGLTIDGYAQRNIVAYKEDKKDPVDVSASLVVEDESLEQEKMLIEFPFAASRGSLIPQYSLNDEGELQKNDVEYRIMRITYGENYENNALKFTDDMKCQQILNRHYSELQDAIRKPMQIEEDVALSLLDLQKIDYSKPVYLSKYGRYFAIISIQWQSDQQTSKVKLLRIK